MHNSAQSLYSFRIKPSETILLGGFFRLFFCNSFTTIHPPNSRVSFCFRKIQLRLKVYFVFAATRGSKLEFGQFELAASVATVTQSCPDTASGPCFESARSEKLKIEEKIW